MEPAPMASMANSRPHCESRPSIEIMGATNEAAVIIATVDEPCAVFMAVAMRNGTTRPMLVPANSRPMASPAPVALITIPNIPASGGNDQEWGLPFIASEIMAFTETDCPVLYQQHCQCRRRLTRRITVHRKEKQPRNNFALHQSLRTATSGLSVSTEALWALRIKKRMKPAMHNAVVHFNLLGRSIIAPSRQPFAPE